MQRPFILLVAINQSILLTRNMRRPSILLVLTQPALADTQSISSLEIPLSLDNSSYKSNGILDLITRLLHPHPHCFRPHYPRPHRPRCLRHPLNQARRRIVQAVSERLETQR
jgi:hypothetical protein